MIREVCSSRRSPLVRLGVDFHVRWSTSGHFDFHSSSSSYSNLKCALQGHHQIENAACALAAAEWLRSAGMTISEAGLRTGLISVQWPGRLECIANNPTIFLDGAHNPAAAATLADFLTEYQQRRPGNIILVIGMQKDKDIRSFMTPFIPKTHTIILTRSTHPLAASADELTKQLVGLPARLAYATSVEDAITKACGLAAHQDIICVTGSLLLVGEVKAHVNGVAFSPFRG